MISRLQFQKTIKEYYCLNKRDFPWRKTKNPYHIVVSEIMLQQTQTSRVVKKYREFIKAFPSWKALSNAPQKKVLTLWQGLGYNRRALNLKRMAETVTKEYRGRLPEDSASLESLPGIGPYTAGAIRTFVWNQPHVFIETNIRTVFLHFFFPNKKNVSDLELFNYIEKTVDTKNPREWYSALMDYGVMLKKEKGNLNTQSKHYRKQTPFKGSDREVRSSILKYVLKEKNVTPLHLKKELSFNKNKIQQKLDELINEGFLKKSDSYIVSI
ncbi:endonuclease III [Candidatus Wolfebacteria bacterium]|nr:MAG: endonuclease III [Candidatus Wolfebacteria bacterium]